MKKNFTVIISLVSILLLIIGIFFWINTKKQNQKIQIADATWIYNKTIKEPLTTETGDNDTIIGNLNENKVSISLPKNAFDEKTTVTVTTPEIAPNFASSEATPIGSPIEITSSGESRLNEKMTVTFSFDKNQLPAETYSDQLMAAYYNGQKWDYLVPANVDMEKGLMSVELYHFSLLGANKVNDDTVLTQQWIHSQALDNTLRSNINDVSDEIANKMVELTLEKMGISDKSISGKVLNDILTDDSYKDMYDAYKGGDVAGFNQKLSLLMGQKIATRVPESAFKKALDNLSGDAAEDVAAVAKAAGYAAEGQYREAAKIIGEQIADKFLITTAGKMAVELVDYQIQSWKSDEVEAAYTAYKNGSDSYFYGYNNDKGDFDTIWNQMRGIRRQLEIEAIAKQNVIRKEVGMPELDDREMDMIRDGVKRSYERQFKSRLEKDTEVEKQEKDLKMLLEAFKTANFLNRSYGPKGLQEHSDLKIRMDVLYHFTQRMMKDTGRFNLNDKQGLLSESALSVHDIVQGARYYFSETGGKEAYQKFLNERFGIALYPELKNLAGTWQNGKMIITDVILSDEAKQQMEDAKDNPDKDGCDLNIDLQSLIGKENPISIAITPNGENEGTMSFASGEDDAKSIPFTYEDGTIKASVSEEGAVGSITLKATEDDTAYALSGNMILNYKGDLVKIIASITSDKNK